jgi:hypothetical protein
MAATQSGAQLLEVRELAELRRQRAIQDIVPKAPAVARSVAQYPVVIKLRVSQTAPPQGTAVPRSSEYPGYYQGVGGTGKGGGGGFGKKLDLAPAALIYGTAVPHSAITSSNPRPAAGRGAHSIVSFAIEPIQLPIVPLSLFW